MADETKITPSQEVINGVIKLRSDTTSTNIQSIAKEIPDITQFNNSETKSVPYSWYVCGQGA